MRISDWSSDVCSSDLAGQGIAGHRVGTGADVDVVVAGRGRAGDGGHRLVESARERRETLREGVAGDGVVAGAAVDAVVAGPGGAAAAVEDRPEIGRAHV